MSGAAEGRAAARPEIRLVPGACQGHGRCYALAPQLFGSDEVDGHAVLLHAGPVPDEHVEAARRAAAACPELAIRVE